MSILKNTSFDERLERVLTLAHVLEQRRQDMVDCAVGDLQFTVKDSAKEVDIAIDRLKMFAEASFLRDREPLHDGAMVNLMLSYNGSAWLNTTITSIYLVGNRVNVKFSSKGRRIMALTQSMYGPIFGGAISFYSGNGRSFIEDSLREEEISSIVIFGFDENVLPYEEAFRSSGKKLIFEGPGQDPFIVFPDADLALALDDLMVAKFMYSGQTCTAPKRIFIHESIYADFLECFVDRVRRLKVGDAANPDTDVSPVGSPLAVERVRAQLADAIGRGGNVLIGGRVDGNLVYPTVVSHCTDEMLGMREEVFGPVAFTSSFATTDEVLARARHHKYGLRAAVFGGAEAAQVARELVGCDYCHPVPGYTFGKFGTVGLNQRRAESWRGAFITRPVGGYGYSGWIWETVNGRFQLKQGPKLLSTETSCPRT
jgi:succinate-semialdehyde dehydrogenase/glutarate-semialdehyde dehydrogenase